MSSSRRIAWCITDLDAGGAERALVEIVTRLPALGWSPTVYCLSGPGELAAPLKQAGIPVECLGARSAWSWGVVRQLTAALRNLQPELLQTFMYHANLAGRWSAWRAGVPVTVCGLRVAERDAPWRMRLDRWSQRLVMHNVAVSQGVADFAVHECGLEPRKVSVIPNGVDYERFANATPIDLTTLGIPAAARVLTFVGRLHPQKAPELLLAAALPLLRSVPRLHLMFVGDGPLREELSATARAERVTDRVHLVGRRADVPGLLKSSTALVLPSRWEGLPNVVLESMAAGCPVIASAIEGSRELIEPGRTGWLFSNGNCLELTRCLRECLSDDRQAAELAESAQRVAHARFAWSTVVDNYASLYARLIASATNC